MMKWVGDSPRLVGGQFLRKGDEVPEGAFSPDEIRRLVELGKIALDVEIKVVDAPVKVEEPVVELKKEEPVEVKPEPEMPELGAFWGGDKKTDEKPVDKEPKPKAKKKKRSKS